MWLYSDVPQFGGENESGLAVSFSLPPHGLEPSRHLCPWDSPGKKTGVGCHSLLQGIFLTQGSNPGLPHCRWILYYLSHKGSPSLGVNYLILQICIKILVIYTYSEIQSVAFFFSVNFYEGSIHRYYRIHSGYPVAQSCLLLIYVNRITYFHFIFFWIKP